ncbi:MAG: radical SAM protein [bacterium]
MKPSIIPIFIPHQGCPHQCVFCNQKTITGHNTIPAPEEINELITSYKKIHPYKEFHLAFYGGSFTGVPHKVQEGFLRLASQALRDREIKSIRVSTRPDYITRDKLLLLKKYGVGVVELGVQSMVDEVLSLSNRGHTSSDTFYAIELLKNMGFKIGIQFMPGLPGDTQDSIFYTVKQIIKFCPDFVRIYPTVVLKDTPLADIYFQRKYTPLTLLEAIKICEYIYLAFLYNDINVIRMGLQANDYLACRDNIIAGPYHPAFKYLVETNLAYKMMEQLIKKIPSFHQRVHNFEANETFVANLYGHKKINIELLKKRHNLADVMIKINNDLKRDQLGFRDNSNSYREINYKRLYELLYLSPVKFR